MALVNEHFLTLPNNYLFSDIARKVSAYKASHPGAEVISLGIGDVTQPLPKAVTDAMSHAVAEMADAATFRGYGPEHGYGFLIDAIINSDYRPRGIELTRDEVFVSDGAKSDCGNIGDILGIENTVGMTDPVYPVYIDSNVMCGRAGQHDGDRWTGITYLPCNAENGFVPRLPERRVDIIYLCYPNNPTGTVLTKGELERWVDYALRNDSLILYDGAYEAYIQDSAIPHSIYEIEGARQCAIELRSFSKTAGFTGVRCGYTVVPEQLTARTRTGVRVPLNRLWNRRQCTKFNGTGYITQRGAEAVYSPEGQAQVRQIISTYMETARLMKAGLQDIGFSVTGGDNAPYLWVRTPSGISSWGFFDMMLDNANVVVTPGVGFGPSGEGYVRLTAFGRRNESLTAVERIKKMMGAG